MSTAPDTARTATSDGDGDAATVDKKHVRTQRVNELAEKIHATKVLANNKKAPSERDKETRLWKEAQLEARRTIRSQDMRDAAKAAGKQAATTARSEATSVVHRNRAQLAPWLMAAPYVALGETAYLAVEYGTANPIGLAATVAASSVGASLLAWRKKLAARIPARFHRKAQAGMGLACSWATAAPLVDNQAGMWLSLVAGTGYLGLSWWRDHDHPIPVPSPDPATADDAVVASDLSEQQVRIRGILSAWYERVADGKRAPLLGSTLEHLSSNGVVDQYRITLDNTGPVSGEKITDVASDVAFRLGVLSTDLSFEVTSDPRVVLLRHHVGAPSYTYTGPVVLCDGKRITSRWEITPGSSVDIVYGYYLDGEGHTSYRVIDSGSVNSLFILGSTGSGKTVTMEVIGIALRFLGAYLLYIDGQGGASSQALQDHADDVYEPDTTGVDQLATVLTGICKARQQELRSDRTLRNRYTYDPQRPPVMLMMEEAHRVFCLPNPNGGTYGDVFGTYGSEIRKLGVGFVAASQDFDLAKTFGGSARLRDAFRAGGSFAAMRLTEKTRIGMLPSSCPALDTVPKHGYGFSPFAERPAALWRVPALVYEPGTGEPDPDAGEQWPEDWMQQFPAAALDERTRLGADVGRAAASERHAARNDTSTSVGKSSSDGSVVHFPGSSTQAGGPVDPDVDALTDSEQRALAAVQGEPHTPTTLANCLNISSQGAGRKLQSLVKKGVVVKREDGRYKAR